MNVCESCRRFACVGSFRRLLVGKVLPVAALQGLHLERDKAAQFDSRLLQDLAGNAFAAPNALFLCCAAAVRARHLSPCSAPWTGTKSMLREAVVSKLLLLFRGCNHDCYAKALSDFLAWTRDAP